MRDDSATGVRGAAGGRAPALLLLLALVALFAGVCHGTPGHLLPPEPGHRAGVTLSATPVLAAPAPAPGGHGCGQDGGEGRAFDLHLPGQTAAGPQLADPAAAGKPVPAAHDVPPPAGPDAGGTRTRAGPCPEPGALLIALGVDRN